MRKIIPSDAPLLARLHARCLPDPWSARAFAETLRMPGTAGLRDGESGFLLWRDLGEEAEILTLCVAPEARRHGIATRLIAAMPAATGDRPVHLELRAGNAPALALYHRLGFREVGRRRAYYPAPGGREDAVLMTRDAGAESSVANPLPLA